MKIGALALLRNKRHVSVQTSCDSWRFGFKQHSVLQEEVLTVFVSGECGILIMRDTVYRIIRQGCTYSIIRLVGPPVDWIFVAFF